MKKVVIVHVRVPKTKWFLGYAVLNYSDGIVGTTPATKTVFATPTEAVAWAQNNGFSPCNHTRWSEAVSVA